jgi:hypothetical protein
VSFAAATVPIAVTLRRREDEERNARLASRSAFIVRVDRPKAAAESVTAVSEAGSQWSMPLTPKLRRRLGGNTCLYFYADLMGDGVLRLGNLAPYQGW